jgi:hypothetical protein
MSVLAKPRLSTTVGAVLLLAAIVAMSAPTSATAGAKGSVILYSNANFTSPTTIMKYPECPAIGPFDKIPHSFDNYPTRDCQAVLINEVGQEYVLCAGRGLVPEAFQKAPRLVFRTGASDVCV